MPARKVDAFIPLGGAPLSSIWAQVDAVIALAAKTRLPAVYLFGDAVRRGGLMSYGTSLAERWKQAAVYVDRILKGARPADLPVWQPTTLELFINRKTAASLGLAIPPALLLQADLVVN